MTMVPSGPGGDTFFGHRECKKETSQKALFYWGFWRYWHWRWKTTI